MIDGYPQHPSVLPGAELELRVATDAPAFRVEFYRWGARPELRGRSDWLEGHPAPHHLPHHDWGEDNVGLDGIRLPAWPAYRLPVPADWPSGVYVAVLVEAGTPDGPRALDARSGRALFVVRAAAPGRVLYKVPLFTYHAYNQVSERHYDPGNPHGGWSLYSEFLDLPITGLPAVSVRRPGGGTGGMPFDTFNPDPFAAGLRQTFAHWDGLAVAWLERAGCAVDFCTDLDLHEEGEALLAPYRLLLSFGHDEYWSEAMRDAAEAFVARGGNAAFFGGNTCWWRISFDAPHAYRRAGHFWPERPENELTGVSFRNAGERPLAVDAPPVGFRVQEAGHWVFAGTGLRDGDVFGDGAHEHLVGYECDGAHFDRERAGPATPTGVDGTPADFAILAVGDVRASGWGAGNGAATLGLHAPGGTVFTAATTDWARVLAQGSAPVDRITRNVVERLSR